LQITCAYNSFIVSRGQLLGTLAFQVFFRQEKRRGMFGDAVAYEHFMGRWSRLVAPLFVEFGSIDDPNEVLDVGSGTGSLAFAILKLKPSCSVVGIDPSREYVAYARSINAFGRRANFEIGDAQNLRFADGTFDSSLSLLAFNFTPDPLKVLCEVRRVTRANGRIAAAVWDYGEGMRMLRVFWDAAAGIDPSAGARDERHMPLCHAGALARLWDECHLKNVEERSIDITTRFDSFPDYWDAFLLKQGPAGTYAASLERHRLQALRNEVKRRLGIPGEDQAFSLPARV
jgi:SAM-dependent methyltransferase